MKIEYEGKEIEITNEVKVVKITVGGKVIYGEALGLVKLIKDWLHITDPQPSSKEPLSQH